MAAREWGRAPPLPPEPPPPLPPEAWAAGPAAAHASRSQRPVNWHDGQLDAFGRPLARGSETAQRQALPPDQHALYAQHGGGRKGVKRGGGPHPAPGSKAARRAAAAAAAAQLAALPAAASGDYLDAYPAVKQLMQRFKNRGIEKFPLGVLNEYAARLMLQVTFHSEQASQAGGFCVEARLTNKRGDETVETGTGLARNKQTGKQLAAAALLERLLETTVDEEQLLDPNAGKPAEDKRKKYGQVQVKPGLGADPSAASFSGSRFGRSSSYCSFGGYGGGGYAAALAHRQRAGSFGGSPGFVRGGALVPSSDGAGMEMRPSPGSAAAQGRYGAAAVTPSSGYRPPSLSEQLSRFQAASLPNADKQFTPTGAVRSASRLGRVPGSAPALLGSRQDSGQAAADGPEAAAAESQEAAAAAAGPVDRGGGEQEEKQQGAVPAGLGWGGGQAPKAAAPAAAAGTPSVFSRLGQGTAQQQQQPHQHNAFGWSYGDAEQQMQAGQAPPQPRQQWAPQQAAQLQAQQLAQQWAQQQWAQQQQQQHWAPQQAPRHSKWDLTADGRALPEQPQERHGWQQRRGRSLSPGRRRSRSPERGKPWLADDHSWQPRSAGDDRYVAERWRGAERYSSRSPERQRRGSRERSGERHQRRRHGSRGSRSRSRDRSRTSRSRSRSRGRRRLSDRDQRRSGSRHRHRSSSRHRRGHSRSRNRGRKHRRSRSRSRGRSGSRSGKRRRREERRRSSSEGPRRREQRGSPPTGGLAELGAARAAARAALAAAAVAAAASAEGEAEEGEIAAGSSPLPHSGEPSGASADGRWEME